MCFKYLVKSVIITHHSANINGDYCFRLRGNCATNFLIIYMEGIRRDID